MALDASQEKADNISEEVVGTAAAWTPPLCCLLPSEFIEGCSSLFGDEETMDASISTFGFRSLSDQIVCITGTPTQQENTCLKVLRHLWQEQYDADEEEEGLFVILVPSRIAGAIVGAKGQKVLALIKETGAQINVSREVLQGLSVQPVTIEGSLKSVALAVAGVSQTVQDFASRGTLNLRDFEFENAEGGNTAFDLNERQDGTPQMVCSLAFLVDMVVAGRVIGKQGSHIVEMQQQTGAKITVLSNMQGARCGDRLVEVQGDDVEARARGVEAVLSRIADDASVDTRTSLVLTVPADAIGYLIGKGGQCIKDIAQKSEADVTLQDSYTIAGARLVKISGLLKARLSAVLSIALKLDELHVRASTYIDDASLDVPVPQSPSVGLRSQAIETAVTQVARPNGQDGYGQNELDGPLSTMAGLQRSPAERALLAGIQASGVLDHRLTIRIPQHIVAELDDVSRRSGARFQIAGEHGVKDPGHIFVTAIGPRMATSLAILYIQDIITLQGGLVQ